MFGAIEVSTGRWVYRLGRRCAADFIALLDQVLRAFPRSPVITVICDNDSIHHARKVTTYPEEQPPAGTAVRRPLQPARQPGRTDLGGANELPGQYCRYLAGPAPADPLLLPQPLPGQMLATAAPRTSPWLSPGYEQNFRNALSRRRSGRDP